MQRQACPKKVANYHNILSPRGDCHHPCTATRLCPPSTPTANGTLSISLSISTEICNTGGESPRQFPGQWGEARSEAFDGESSRLRGRRVTEQACDTRRPIGVFDSGLGGLTVVRALQRRLTDERLIYLGDTARVPYGTKSAETVVRYAVQVADFLRAHHVKYIVVACNTASAHALSALEDLLPVPVMGVIEPGASLAARRTQGGSVGVLGTLGTVESGAYTRAMQRIRPELSVFSQACPLLVPLAEEGWIDHPVTRQVVRHYLMALQSHTPDVDTLVLGCTHYPLLRDAISRQADEVFGHSVTLVDSAEAVADAVGHDLEQRGLLGAQREGRDRYFFSDVNRFSDVAGLFLGRSIPEAERADL
jgi:glutamate racemase